MNRWQEKYSAPSQWSRAFADEKGRVQYSIHPGKINAALIAKRALEDAARLSTRRNGK